jgi:hypothetical protein
LRNVSAQFPANSRRMHSDLISDNFLYNYCLKKGFNLIPLYQTELCEVFRQSNPKNTLLGQMAKFH